MRVGVAPRTARRSTTVADDFDLSNSRPFPIARLVHAAYGKLGVFEKCWRSLVMWNARGVLFDKGGDVDSTRSKHGEAATRVGKGKCSN